LIHLEQVRPQILVNDNVKAQQLKAHLILEVVWLARAVQVMHVGLCDAHSFYNNVLHALNHFVDRLITVGLS
jgi:hypothetical protein